MGVAVDECGTLIVVDSGNNRLQVVDSSWNFCGTIKVIFIRWAWMYSLYSPSDVNFVNVPGGQSRVATIGHLLRPGELGPVRLQLRGGQRGLLQAPDPGHVREISHRCYY